MKELGKALEADPKKSRMPNKTAVDLGIQYTRFDGNLKLITREQYLYV
jgi:hypothetical protein